MARSNPSLTNRHFVLLVAGEGLSILGDQLTRIGAIWLILSIADAPLAVGFWLAAGAVPRAVFMLIGGAVTDRLSSRPVMLATNAARLVLVAGLAAGAALEQLSLPVLHVFAVLFGIAGAFYAPALSSILPRLVPSDRLQRANAVVQGLMQIGAVIGPPVSALLLAWLLSGSAGFLVTQGGSQGPYAAVFALDALTFAASIWTLTAMGTIGRPAGSPSVDRGLISDIGEGLGHVMRSPQLRAFMLVALAANIGLAGPIASGLPLLAKFALPQGVTALGLLSAAAAAGGVAGLLVAGAVPVRNARFLLNLPYVIMIILGALMVMLGQTTSLMGGALVIACMTLLATYLDIQILTWLQQRTPEALLGRVMSVLQFAALGLAPASMAVAGLFGAQTQALFAAFGVFTLLTGLLLWAARPKPCNGLSNVR